jgi:hypothetical protein
MLSPLNVVDLLSYGPGLLDALLPGCSWAGLDLRWFRIFRCGQRHVLTCLHADQC